MDINNNHASILKAIEKCIQYVTICLERQTEMEGLTMYSIYDIADWFLSKEQMTPKKLQKLTYYAVAWCKALLNKDLINDSDFEAWAHGPASHVLYSKYKEYGWSFIDKNVNLQTDIDEADLDLLESVWITYGDKSANELEALTHTEEPWKDARRRSGVSEGESSNEKISTDDMGKYYKKLYVGD